MDETKTNQKDKITESNNKSNKTNIFIKNKDFVKIDYTGTLLNEGYIFDTTEEGVAKSNGLFNPGVKYGSIVTCVGEKMILSGLDDSLIGKSIGGEYDVVFNSEGAFGKRSAKMIKLVPMNVFKKQNIQPQIGLQVTFDGSIGVIKTISGGRVIVDFNHPLSGKDLKYHVKIKNIVKDVSSQIKAILELKLNIKNEDIFVKVEESNKKAELTLNFELPKDAQDKLSEYIKELVNINEITYFSDEKKSSESNIKSEK